MTTRESDLNARGLGRAIVAVALLGSVVGGVGAPLITAVALDLDIALDEAQWTLTITLFTGAVTAPVLGRLGAGSQRQETILGTLALVALGGLLTAVPAPFGVLLAGRGLQGLGLGVIPLLMSLARDTLPADRARKTIATVSVASTVGIGVAYPLMGFISEAAGLRAAYGCGFLLSLTAFIVAWRAFPRSVPTEGTPVDALGAVLLGLGVLGVLLTVSQPSVWNPLWAGAAILLIACAAFGCWLHVERRSQAPLVDLRLFSTRNILLANIAMFGSAIAMYLLFSLLTRFVQTPVQAGYGFDLSNTAAGAALIPFSVLGFAAGRLTPWLVDRLSAKPTFIVYTAFTASTVVVVLLLDSLAAVLAAMSVLGLGVGGISAIMPQLVLTGVPKSETASVLSINQIVRASGFSIGSALAGLLLVVATAPGTLFPAQLGYVTAALWALPLLALSVIAVLLIPREGRD
ncbi:MFS transporter [Brevibacterium casei]|uniref:Major Facilitator Superfamily protein n=2 Tax=Bacteria TaxID=2 RepID=A0A2H1JB95_9MICO|nr:MFS transporter [Brevibacterium casei]QPR38944.1 MFS transporter [Brevibacterium casei]QPR43110.1 MFS transporter [Brevibacterium casei]QQT69871.1 MFS transporter [Brevibacterium casei]SMX84624.1 Major Facilitator Superfamily protein [Brevibacterium casei CIP 102111]